MCSTRRRAKTSDSRQSDPAWAAAGGWADVGAGELDPGVGVLVRRGLGEADDELGRVALLAQQAVEDERADEAARLAPAEAQAPVDGAGEPGGGLGRAAALGPAEAGDEGGKLLAAYRPARTSDFEAG